MKIHKWSRKQKLGVEEHEFCGGRIAVCSLRCPDKETDNEDEAVAIELTDDHGILAVADGMGGHAWGDRAAETVVTSLVETCSDIESTGESVRSNIVDAIESANRQIIEWGIGAGTTVTVAEFHDKTVRFIHVGDSTALLCSNRGRIKHYTIAHAPVAQAVELGIIDEQSALRHEDRNVVDNYVGFSEMRIEVGPAIPMAKRDTMTLATDGLFDNLTLEATVDHVRAGQLLSQSKRMLLEVQNRMSDKDGLIGKPDDCTFINFRRT